MSHRPFVRRADIGEDARSSPVALPPPLTIKRHMSGREIHEEERASTPLELLFDLTAVVAVAQLHRERGFLWGYGHALVFIALAALGGVLEVVADALEGAAAHGSTTHVPAGAAVPEVAFPAFAMGMVAVTVGVFFAALWWLGGQSTRRQARNPKYVLPVVSTCFAAWFLVHRGLPLPWGLLTVAVGPAALIGWVTRDRLRRPEHFAVR